MTWQDTLAALDAALKTADPILKPIGAETRKRLIYVGRVTDGVESAEHAAWRTAAAEFIASADRVAQRFAKYQPADTPPAQSLEKPASVNPENPLTAVPVVRLRLHQAAFLASAPEAERTIAHRTLMGLMQRVPAEPQRFGEGSVAPREWLGKSRAEATRRARAANTDPDSEWVAIAEEEAEAWIRLATPAP